MKRLLHILLGFGFTWSIIVVADDTDIYINNTSSNNPPYLMFVMDYRQDLSGPYCRANGPVAEQCKNLLNTPSTFHLLQALDAMVNGVPVGAAQGDANGDGLRDSAAVMSAFEASKIQALVAVTRAVFAKFEGIYVGMMISNKDGGGTILRGYKEFVAGDANGAKAELVNILAAIPMPSLGNEYHESQPKELHYEWYRYINGGEVVYGDQTANNFQGTNNPPPDPTIFGATGSYNSPFSATPSDFECTKFYEVYATSGNEGGSDSDLTAEITGDMSAAAAAKFEDMASYMANNDILPLVPGEQNLKTWIIQVGDSAAFADNWAEAAGTDDQYMTVAKGANLANLQATLESAFIEALSVSTTFVSASVPVNVFNRIQTLDNFYIALFEAKSTERWPGNIKKLRLVDTSIPLDGDYDDIYDVNNTSAFNDADGRIKFEAVTYWTDPLSLPAADPEQGEIDGRDGRAVRRGGAGQKIPGFISGSVGVTTATGSRQLYVEPASGSVLDPFNADAITATNLQALMGVGTVGDAQSLIAWTRGIDVDDEDNDGNLLEARPWLMGDVIHSRPLALNYGATPGYSVSNPQVRLFFGTNAGMFTIIENTSSLGAQSGEEKFAFIPRESLPILRLLRSDNGSSRHPYGVDGEPVALVADHDSDGNIEPGDEVYVYFGMRRGGKSYYALDVSNPNATPTLKWKITKTTGGDFDELGYTFSTPRVVKVKFENTPRDVLIFAGGYDLQKDTDTGVGRNADTEGNAIYMVDARTGALVWKAGLGSGGSTNTVFEHPDLNRSIPSSVATLDSNGNGVTDRLYVGDTGGIVWRVDLPEGSTANHRRDNWEITKFADLSDAAESEDRRFFHAPDVVQTRDDSGMYDGVLIASGDRASPLETTDDNMLFLLKDRNTTSGLPSATVVDDDSVPDVTNCVTGAEVGCAAIDHALGWRIDLPYSGEKGLASPLVASGKAFFTSYRPEGVGTGCVPNEGTGALYVVNLRDGTAAFNGIRDFDLGPGIPPAVTALGDNTLIIPGSGILDPFGTTSSTEKQKLIQTGGKSMYIIYWRETGVDDL